MISALRCFSKLQCMCVCCRHHHCQYGNFLDAYFSWNLMYWHRSSSYFRLMFFSLSLSLPLLSLLLLYLSIYMVGWKPALPWEYQLSLQYLLLRVCISLNVTLRLYCGLELYCNSISLLTSPTDLATHKIFFCLVEGSKFNSWFAASGTFFFVFSCVFCVCLTEGRTLCQLAEFTCCVGAFLKFHIFRRRKDLNLPKISQREFKKKFFRVISIIFRSKLMIFCENRCAYRCIA